MTEKPTYEELEKRVLELERTELERKRSEELQRETEEKYRTLFESSRDAIMTLAPPTWLFTSGNQATVELFRVRDEAEFISLGPWQLSPERQPDDKSSAEKAMEMIKTAMRNGSHFFEWMHCHSDGTPFPAEVLLTQMEQKGRVLIQATVRDITERKRVEEALKESEQRFRELFNNMGSCVAIYNSPDNGESFIFTDLNESGLKYAQKEMDEVVGREVREVFPGVEALGLFNVFKRVWRTRIPEHHPSSMYKDDKLVLWVENYVCKLPSGELVAIYEDTTARMKAEEAKKQLEKQLFQAQKIESIGNLAGGIAHDFNNILSSIIGYTELSIDQVEKGTHLADNLQEVYTAGKRARDLVKQILAFARQSDEEKKPIQVNTIAEEALRLIRSTIPTSIEIKHNLESNSLIMGNPTQIHQLFMNLCTNAAQAMENTGGILEVGLADVELNDKSPLAQSGLEPGNYLKATISDTGPGIATDVIHSIFEPYFTTKSVGKGTGMGLAVVYGIVKTYGGKIIVDSELGKGTVFSIYLPITKKREDYRPYEEEKLPSGTERILFVDDELPIAKMGSQILERLGYQVTFRTSSIEALEVFRFKPKDFDLVITDMTMPNMTGDRLAAELMKIRSDIPVILCTGYSKKISDEAAKEIGIKAFAYKPVVTADLAKTARKVLDNAKT